MRIRITRLQPGEGDSEQICTAGLNEAPVMVTITQSEPHSLVPVLYSTSIARTAHLPVHFSKHEIHGPDNGHRICQQMSSTYLIHGSQVRKTRCSNLASIWPLAPIAPQKHAHFTLRRFDRAVRLTWWYCIALGVQQEMVDKCLHVLLHRS